MASIFVPRSDLVRQFVPPRLVPGPTPTLPLPIPILYSLQLPSVHIVWLRSAYPEVAEPASKRPGYLKA